MSSNPDFEVKILANPKGDAHIVYTIESEIFINTNEFYLSTPGFMYDYYSLRGITWPLSRKVRELKGRLADVEGIDTGLDQKKLEVVRRKDGHQAIVVPESAIKSSSTERFSVHFVIPNMVNRDIIFYKLILPVTGPATEIDKDYFNMNAENRYVDIEDTTISIRSHFAFNTFSYSVRAKRFNLNTGEAMVGFPSRIKEYIMGIVPLSEYSGGFIHTELEGDIIKATWEGNLNQDEEVDFQIRGAHLPILGKFNRAIFWAVVWIFIIFVFVSPFITFILEYMMGSIS